MASWSTWSISVKNASSCRLSAGRDARNRLRTDSGERSLKPVTNNGLSSGRTARMSTSDPSVSSTCSTVSSRASPRSYAAAAASASSSVSWRETGAASPRIRTKYPPAGLGST